MTKFSRTRSRRRSAPRPDVERRLPASLKIGGFLLFTPAGVGTVVLTIVVLVRVLQGAEPVDALLTWGMAAQGYTWPLGVPMVALGPVSVVAGWRLMRNGPRLPAVLASLGWLAINGLWYLETGREFLLVAWVLSVPFIVWGTLAEARRMGLRAALAA